MNDLNGKLNHQITLHGTAMDAHAGAMVVTDDDQALYIDGLKSWADAVVGKPIQVSGTLRRKTLGPKPRIGRRGLVSHGMVGKQLVIEDATWTVVAD